MQQHRKKTAELEAQLSKTSKELNEILHSRGWQILLLAYRLRDRIFPATSLRAKIIEKLLSRNKSEPCREGVEEDAIPEKNVTAEEKKGNCHESLVKKTTGSTEESEFYHGNDLDPLLEGTSYFTYVFHQNLPETVHLEYRPYKDYDKIDVDIRLIAFYLPQFHPIPENDKAWGKGFTEWTNTAKAIPQFFGHYQPRLPGELGYYDLRLKDVQKRQIELAKNYGIYGFCYHFYWFNGRKVLDRPLQQVLDDPDLDFPFCINWANENWSKRWDGLDQDIILSQNHSPEDDLAFLEAVKPILTDSRYIRVHGKPVLMVYRPSLFPDAKGTAERWREYALKIGIGELYLILSHSFEHLNPTEYGFDAAVEFAPNTFEVTNIADKVVHFNPDYQGIVYDYREAMYYSLKFQEKTYVKFRGICPSWDNEARKPGRGSVFWGAKPSLYGRWLHHLLEYTNSRRQADEKIIFINAWNEWAEGAYLEPDSYFGYAYLDETHRQVRKYDVSRLKKLDSSRQHEKSSDIAVIANLWEVSQWPGIRDCLLELGRQIDLHLSIPASAGGNEIDTIVKEWPAARIFSFESRGGDFLPSMRMLEYIAGSDYNYLFKIFCEIQPRGGQYEVWFNQLLKSQEMADNAMKEIDDGAGIVTAADNVSTLGKDFHCQVPMLLKLASRMEVSLPDTFNFPTKTTFWADPRIFFPLVETIEESDFDFEDDPPAILHGEESNRELYGMMCTVANRKIVTL